MGIKRGLKSITEHNDALEAKFNDKGDKAKWFSLKANESAKVAFLQELDPDSENFSTKNDLGFLAVEHSNPDDFKRKGVCSADEGPCWACEKNQASWNSVKDYKGGWKQRTRLYINVLVDNGLDEPFVAVLSQGNGPKSVTPALIEQAGEMGTVTDKWFKIKRTGAGFSDTSYTLTALKEHGLNVEDYEVFDLMKVVREVPYEQQEAHYLGGTPSAEAASDEPALAGAAAGDAPDEW
jgi:hypothetical protein